jgi:hypothetical protein
MTFYCALVCWLILNELFVLPILGLAKASQPSGYIHAVQRLRS